MKEKKLRKIIIKEIWMHEECFEKENRRNDDDGGNRNNQIERRLWMIVRLMCYEKEKKRNMIKEIKLRLHDVSKKEIG